MARWFPKGRALYERVRRPSTMSLITTLVLVPVLALTPGMGPKAQGDVSAELEAVDANVAASRAVSTDVSEAVSASAESSQRSVSSAWRDRTMERERDDALQFARRYRISTSLAREIVTAAEREGIEPQIGFGLVQTESSFRRTVVSYAGAVGYTQLLPSTARYMEPGTKRSDLFDTRTNLRIGFKYLNYLVDKYNGDMRLALTAYNRGPGTVNRLLRQGRNPENGYATKVLRHLG